MSPSITTERCVHSVGKVKHSTAAANPAVRPDTRRTSSPAPMARTAAKSAWLSRILVTDAPNARKVDQAAQCVTGGYVPRFRSDRGFHSN